MPTNSESLRAMNDEYKAKNDARESPASRMARERADAFKKAKYNLATIRLSIARGKELTKDDMRKFCEMLSLLLDHAEVAGHR